MKHPVATEYLKDFLAYYRRALALENQNHRGARKRATGDALQDNVSIYDTVHRRYAGFSNVLRDLHAIDAKVAPTTKWKLNEWLYVYGVHRMTGSGASFFPKSEGDRRHGYCNVIAPTLGTCKTIDQMVKVIQEWKQPMFTSYGNQPPPFPKPEAPYEQGGKYFFCEVWPSFVEMIADHLKEGNAHSVAGLTDWMLELNVVNNFKRFKFTYTAFVMDIADWHPQFMDPLSQCHYGANCMIALNAMFSSDNRTKGKGFYDACMDELVPLCSKILGAPAAPMDIEDVACDAVRYWGRFVPKFGYDHLETQKRETLSTIGMSEFEAFCQRV